MKFKWGIIGAGGIANAFAKGVLDSKEGELYAIGSRNEAKAKNFAAVYNIPKAYGSYEELLADSDVDGVYICTPHPMHAEWAIKAAKAKKHILLEKPATLNYPEAAAVIAAVYENHVFFMEAFMYRCHPQTQKAVDIIKNGDIGEIRFIQASFGFNAGYNPESRLFADGLGGGGILDVGCYAASFTRLLAGAGLGKDFANPIDIKAQGFIGDTGVDFWTSAILTFENNIVANISSAVQVNLPNTVVVCGSKGTMTITSPWFCNPGEGNPSIIVTGEVNNTYEFDNSKSLYSYEADLVVENIEFGKAKSPAMTPADTLGNMKTLDYWRRSIGLVYKKEQPSFPIKPISGMPLKADQTKMKYGEIKGVDKPVSKLILGAMLHRATIEFPHTCALYDAFYEAGGNTIDTAFVYGNVDTYLGNWMHNNNVREDIVVVAKGAHTPNCSPEGLVKELEISLDKLKTDYVDIYLTHRDNPEIPASEFIDVLNDLKSKGIIKAFGGSNWTAERIDQANEYAIQNGKTPFTVISNNFSLARAVDVPWEGCISATTQEWREWLGTRQIPNLAWSSLAMGYFGHDDDTPDYMYENKFCWDCEENREKRRRLKALAIKKNVFVNQLAIAYNFYQDFPIFAITGPSDVIELKIALGCLNIDITKDEIDWLNLKK